MLVSASEPQCSEKGYLIKHDLHAAAHRTGMTVAASSFQAESLPSIGRVRALRRSFEGDSASREELLISIQPPASHRASNKVSHGGSSLPPGALANSNPVFSAVLRTGSTFSGRSLLSGISSFPPVSNSSPSSKGGDQELYCTFMEKEFSPDAVADLDKQSNYLQACGYTASQEEQVAETASIASKVQIPEVDTSRTETGSAQSHPKRKSGGKRLWGKVQRLLGCKPGKGQKQALLCSILCPASSGEDEVIVRKPQHPVEQQVQAQPAKTANTALAPPSQAMTRGHSNPESSACGTPAVIMAEPGKAKRTSFTKPMKPDSASSSLKSNGPSSAFAKIEQGKPPAAPALAVKTEPSEITGGSSASLKKTTLVSGVHMDQHRTDRLEVPVKKSAKPPRPASTQSKVEARAIRAQSVGTADSTSSFDFTSPVRSEKGSTTILSSRASVNQLLNDWRASQDVAELQAKELPFIDPDEYGGFVNKQGMPWRPRVIETDGSDVHSISSLFQNTIRNSIDSRESTAESRAHVRRGPALMKAAVETKLPLSGLVPLDLEKPHCVRGHLGSSHWGEEDFGAAVGIRKFDKWTGLATPKSDAWIEEEVLVPMNEATVLNCTTSTTSKESLDMALEDLFTESFAETKVSSYLKSFETGYLTGYLFVTATAIFPDLD